MNSIAPGWYKDPADPTTQRYWDGEGWTGAPIPADATPPDGPPPPEPVAPPVAAAPAPAQMTAEPWNLTRPGTSPPGGSSAVPGPVRPAPGPVMAPPQYGYHSGFPTAVAPRPHGLALATVGARFVARMVDAIVVLVLCVIANAWFAIQFWHGFEPYWTEAVRRGFANDTSTDNLPAIPESAGTLLLLMCIATTAVWFAYEVPAIGNSGQTIGKRLLGIKVVRLESAEPLGFGRSFRRWGRLGLPTLLWYCCGVGLVLQAIDCLFAALDRPLHQALHDKTAATVVVQVPRPTPQPGGSRADQS